MSFSGTSEYVALLSEMNPCPVAIGAAKLVFSPDAPLSLDTVPHCNAEPLFTSLHIGGRDVHVVFCDVQDEEPRLWVDTRGDADLTGVGDGRPGWRWGWHGFTWQYVVSLPYEGGGGVRFAVRFSALPRLGATEPPWYTVHMYTAGYRQGLLQLEDNVVPFGAATTDPEGYFHDLDHLYIILDLTGDGELDTLAPMPARKPFFIDGEPYLVSRASACGRRVSVQPAPEIPVEPVLLMSGRQLPQFDRGALDGRRVRSSELLGGVTVVGITHMAACTPEAAEVTCGGPAASRLFGETEPAPCMQLHELPSALETWHGLSPDVAQWLLILLDVDHPCPEQVGEAWPGWKVLWDPKGRELLGWDYDAQMLKAGRFPRVIVLDQAGFIRYTDADVVETYDGFGCLRVDLAEPILPQLAWALARLLLP